jgi:hypothetical protein
MLLKIVRGKLWGKQSCPEGSKRPEMPVLPDTADRPQDRAAQPLVRRRGSSLYPRIVLGAARPASS